MDNPDWRHFMGTGAAVQAITPIRTYSVPRAVPVLRDVSLKSGQCTLCNLRQQCLPTGMDALSLADLQEAAQGRRKIRRGEVLYQAGDSFRAIYAVWLGFFKSYAVTEDGRGQITGFQMGGDILGLDGIDTAVHTLTVMALEDSEVCVFPYAQLGPASSHGHALQHQVHRAMSREIVREHNVMMLLGTMRAEERVATFLLNLSTRFAARGYAGAEFNLRMTREEIGSYLGLKLETVSRILSKFQEAGLIATRNRYVRLLDKMGLAELAGQPTQL
ncbi:MAG TPA: helix-turn-helix domain-containing protein [Casimicrobiaceae bacterium]